MAATFTRTWQRPPTETELKGLVDDYVREEIATREALAMGLDRDDTVIRRRLRQKLEFLVEDSPDAGAGDGRGAPGVAGTSIPTSTGSSRRWRSARCT